MSTKRTVARSDRDRLIATMGKVFTLQNLHRLIESTKAGEFRTR